MFTLNSKATSSNATFNQSLIDFFNSIKSLIPENQNLIQLNSVPTLETEEAKRKAFRKAVRETAIFSPDQSESNILNLIASKGIQLNAGLKFLSVKIEERNYVNYFLVSNPNPDSHAI